MIVWDTGTYPNVTGRDGIADARRNPVSTEPKPILSGRTVEQVADQGRE